MALPLLALRLREHVTDTAQMDALTHAKSLLQAGDYNAAARAAKQALAQSPDNTDALYLLAVIQRYQGQYERAFETIAKLIDQRPNYGRAFQEEGHLRRARADVPRAIIAYAAAVKANPGLPASWKALADLYAHTENKAAADHASKQVERLAKLPRELVSATSFLAEGQIYKAEQIVRAFLQSHPHHVEAMRLLAQVGLKLNVLDDAEFLLESCLEFEPDNLLARIDYFQVLNRRQKYEKALEQANLIKQKDPDNPAVLLMYANALMAVGRYEDALAVFDAIGDGAPDMTQLHMARGHALKTIGKQEGAVAAYHAAYDVRPDFGDAYWSLANLKTYEFSDDELRQMAEQQQLSATSAEDRIHLCFALGKAYEDRSDATRAFAYYERGNMLKKKTTRYSADRMEADFERQKQVCTAELFDAKQGMGCKAPDPIFIVGLPRAGSTLVEQILASHSQVDGTLELPHILATAHRLGGRTKRNEESRYPAILSELAEDKLEALGRAYIDDTQVYRSGAPFFTDKMPNNFRHIGLIKRILPNAKIIDARRDAMACCFSGFKQLFAEGQEFTYDLDDIGRYYRGYVDLMDHWDHVLPGQVLRVQYEDTVADLETQVRRLLDFCGLPFEQACVDFHKTERAVRTASSEQVRQPIFKSGVEQWRYFEKHLEPLKQALGPDLIPDEQGRN